MLSRAKISQTRILLAARTSPADLGLQLLSLNSQLSKAVFFHIPNGKDEADRHAILLAALERRGISLEADVIRYLLDKGPRTHCILFDTFCKLTLSENQRRF